MPDKKTNKKEEENKKENKELKEEKEAKKENIDEEKGLKKNKKEYIYAVGRRKTSSAQVKLYKKGSGEVTINQKDIKDYFPTEKLQEIVYSPLKVIGQVDKLKIWAKVVGGGKTGQAEAIRHGVSRALLEINPNFKKPLRKHGYLTRDPRVKERKKPGLKRARRAPQWSKR